MSCQINHRPIQYVLRLALDIDTALQHYDGAVTRPYVQEAEGEGDEAGRVVNIWPDEEDEADEVREKEAAAVALENKLGRILEWFELIFGAQDELETGQGCDDALEEEGELGHGDHDGR